ncbi:MAG: hypothetical protein ACREL1_01815 [bacterium]
MATKIKFPDKAAQAKLKKQVVAKLSQGRAKIKQLEKKIRSGQAGREIAVELKKAKAQLEKLKGKYREHEKKALNYIEHNPKKALLTAAVVGAVAGTILAGLRSVGVKKKKKK